MLRNAPPLKTGASDPWVKRSAVTRSGTNTSVLAGTCQAVESQCVKTEFKSIPTSVMPRAPRNREERQGRRVAAPTCRAVEPKIARTSWCKPCKSNLPKQFCERIAASGSASGSATEPTQRTGRVRVPVELFSPDISDYCAGHLQRGSDYAFERKTAGENTAEALHCLTLFP